MNCLTWKMKDSVQDLVDQYYERFVEILPKYDEIDVDEDAVARAGKLDKRALKRPLNQMMGNVLNPRVIVPQIRPRFLASIVCDVSLSMGEDEYRRPEPTKI